MLKSIVDFLFGPCLRRAISTNDSPGQVKRKKLVIILSCIVAAVTLNTLFLTYGKKLLTFVANLLFHILTVILLTLLIVLKKNVTDSLLEVSSVIMLIGISLQDIEAGMLQNNPSWPLFVIIVDVLLVCEAPMRATVGVVCWCCLLLLVISIESSYSFGLFDLEYQQYSQEHRREKFDCEKLPCNSSIDISLLNLLTQFIVFLMDFFCTRGFAAAVLEEKNNILASVDAANAIATSLSRFDLEQATSLLEDADIPGGLRDALEQILCNLRSYRPYLPQSCIPVSYSSDESTATEETPRTSQSGSGASTTIESLLQQQPAASYRVRRKFECLSASLLVANIRNSFAVLQYSQDSFNGLISDMISATSDVIVKHRGTLDLFLGDRVFANFGATRSHVNHPTSCTDAAMAITSLADRVLGPYQKFASNNLSMNIGMASGKLVCGDLGSENVMRFSVIGKLSLLVGVVERVASIKGVPMLTEGGLYRAVMHTAEIRVHLQTVFYDDTEHVLYELIPKKDVGPAEWMYQLEEVGAGKWDNFNKVAATLLTSKSNVAISKPEEHSPEYDELRSFMKTGFPDPIVVTKR